MSPKPASRYGLAQVWPPVPYTAPLHVAESERLKLRIFLDRSIVEVFANDQVAVTARCYPDPDSTGISYSLVVVKRNFSRWTSGR